MSTWCLDTQSSHSSSPINATFGAIPYILQMLWKVGPWYDAHVALTTRRHKQKTNNVASIHSVTTFFSINVDTISHILDRVTY